MAKKIPINNVYLVSKLQKSINFHLSKI